MHCHRVRGFEKAAATLSCFSGALHAMAGPEHVEEWWAYGLFFYGAAVAQVSFGLALLTQGIEGWGGWTMVRLRVYEAGILGNVTIIGLWVVTRTVGVPVGPQAFEPEGLGVLDVTSKAAEVILVGLLVHLRTLDKKKRAARAL